jgi:hypothetical protein
MAALRRFSQGKFAQCNCSPTVNFTFKAINKKRLFFRREKRHTHSTRAVYTKGPCVCVCTHSLLSCGVQMRNASFDVALRCASYPYCCTYNLCCSRALKMWWWARGFVICILFLASLSLSLSLSKTHRETGTTTPAALATVGFAI